MPSALGFPLPVALREAYRLFGRRRDLTANQDPVIPPTQVGLWDGVLFFRRENQDCAFWGVAEQDLTLPDPPVLVEVADDWIHFTETVSLAMVELVLDEVLFADDSLYDACELPAELMPVLRENFHRIQLPDYPMWASADDSPIRWYSAPDVILRLDGIQNWAWLHARARTPAGLEVIRHLLPGRWVR